MDLWKFKLIKLISWWEHLYWKIIILKTVLLNKKFIFFKTEFKYQTTSVSNYISHKTLNIIICTVWHNTKAKIKWEIKMNSNKVMYIVDYNFKENSSEEYTNNCRPNTPH